MKERKYIEKKSKKGTLKAYQTLALAEEHTRDKETNAAKPSDTNVEEARTWCRVNQK